MLKSIGPMKRIMTVMCVFGLFIGVIFPFYANLFIQWVPGKKIPFFVGCYAVGYIIGMFGFYIVHVILRQIDNYYKQTLKDKLGITFSKSSSKKDMILAMKEEFEELLDDFALMRQEEEERLKLLSITDSLTSIYNHRSFFEYFDRVIKKGSKEIAILFCDIDHFKVVNDMYGHVKGDWVLKEIAQLMKQEVSTIGEVFRYGGEEFVVLLADYSAEEAYEVAERIRSKINHSNDLQEWCNYLPVTISVGIAVYPAHGLNGENLIDKADKAMYYAKQNGRNQCHIYYPDIDAFLSDNFEEFIREEMLVNCIYSLSAAIDAKDSYTEKHSECVTKFALCMAEKLCLSQRAKNALRIGGLLHDCGKIGVPDVLIHKPSNLTQEEWEIIKSHTSLGSSIIKYIIRTPEIESCIRNHHERWDGRGYPDGLLGEEIPLYARIICIADAYHAMVSDRPYRKALTQEEAFKELIKNKGTQFDPILVDVFIEAMKEYEQEKIG